MARFREVKRVVVTGIGLVTSKGVHAGFCNSDGMANEFWQAMLNAENSTRRIVFENTTIDTSRLRTKIAAPIDNFNPELFMDRKRAKTMGRNCQFALVAAQMAAKDANITVPFVGDDQKINGVIVGCGVGDIITLQNEIVGMHEKGAHLTSPRLINMMIVDAPSGVIANSFHAKACNFSVTSACASGGHSIGVAFNAIRDGYAKRMFAGGTEAAICEAGMAGFCANRAMSTRNEEPEKASRPFDRERDGFVMGEGAGVFVLEDFDYAVNRGARIYAEITGFGMNADGYHDTHPCPDGSSAMECMKMVILGAKINPHDIGYINPHGTSTPEGDKAESCAIKSLFGEYTKQLPVTSSKSILGHTLGAAGAIEAGITVGSIYHEIIHPNRNYDYPDPECDLYLPTQVIRKPIEYAISNSFGFWGHNSCLLFSKFRI